MQESEFRGRLEKLGYGEPRLREYAPDTSGELHAHEFAAMLLVVRGRFSLAFEDQTIDLSPGDVHEVPAGRLHDERTGADGAAVLLAKK